MNQFDFAARAVGVASRVFACPVAAAILVAAEGAVTLVAVVAVAVAAVAVAALFVAAAAQIPIDAAVALPRRVDMQRH